MLWPVILPFQITACAVLAMVGVMTAARLPRRWGRFKILFVASILALILFIPSCTGVMYVVDSIRFGDFHYDSFTDVPDFRSRRYLPESAIKIQMRKYANGYQARYDISADDFATFLDQLWEEYGEHSAVERGGYRPAELTKPALPAIGTCGDRPWLTQVGFLIVSFRRLDWNQPNRNAQ